VSTSGRGFEKKGFDDLRDVWNFERGCFSLYIKGC